MKTTSNLALPYAELGDAATIEDVTKPLAEKLDTMRDEAPANACFRTLGTGEHQACAGNDARLSDQRVPTNGSVTSAKIAEGAVTKSKIAEGAITAANLYAGAVGTTALGVAAVTSEKIAEGAVTAVKIASNAVTTAKIASGAVTGEKISARTITTENLALGSVLELLSTGTEQKIAYGEYTPPGGFDSAPGRSRWEGNVAHGLGVTPRAVFLLAKPILIQENGGTIPEAVAISCPAKNSSIFTVVMTALGTTNNGTTFWWAAIG